MAGWSRCSSRWLAWAGAPQHPAKDLHRTKTFPLLLLRISSQRISAQAESHDAISPVSNPAYNPTIEYVQLSTLSWQDYSQQSYKSRAASAMTHDTTTPSGNPSHAISCEHSSMRPLQFAFHGPGRHPIAQIRPLHPSRSKSPKTPSAMSDINKAPERACMLKYLLKDIGSRILCASSPSAPESAKGQSRPANPAPNTVRDSGGGRS